MLDISPFVQEFRQDTLGGDRTSQITIPPGTRLCGDIRCRQPIVATATALISELPTALNLDLAASIIAPDGARLEANALVGQLSGDAIHLLALERTLLNALQILCGIATETARWVDALPANITLLDTRKTHPLLRTWERLAVRSGGGRNHRYNLADTVLIKDNHLIAGDGVATAVGNAVAAAGHSCRILCEVESLDQAKEAVAAGVHGLLIDNVAPSQWPDYWDSLPERISLEFSGGITFDTLETIPAPPRRIWISTSKIVLGANAVDLGLDIRHA